MSSAVQSGSPLQARTIRRALAWLAWLVAGAMVFGLPELLGAKGAVTAAFVSASTQAKACVAVWFVGSVVLLARLFLSLQRAAQPAVPADAAASRQRG